MPKQSSIRLTIQGMTCASCVGRVERALSAMPGVTDTQVNLANETATVTYQAGAVTPSAMIDVATKAGYPATIAAPSAQADTSGRKQREAANLARMTWIAAGLTLPVFVVEMGGHLFPAWHHLIASTVGLQASWTLQFVLTTLVVFGPGAVFFRKGIPALLRAAPDMNSLVALGTSSAYIYSTIATFAPRLLPAGTAAVYYEAAASIVVLILLGRTLEARAKGRTGAAIVRLIELAPKTARIERDGLISERPLSDIVVGDRLHTLPGERVAADATVVTGRSYVDESMITGEPRPVEKTSGAQVTGGTMNSTGALVSSVTHVGADTVLARIVAMVEQAQGAKLPVQAMVDRVTLWFVPAVLALAAITVAVWLAFGPSPTLAHALVAGVSVLIIACPCAMGLATPTSIMVGLGRAAELGVLFRKGDALQSLQTVKVVAFDKTGTLTSGRPELMDIHFMPGFDETEVLSLLAGAEAGSEHPVAKAVLRAAAERGIAVPHVTQFAAIPGYGVQAEVAGRAIWAGADRLMRRENIALPASNPAASIAAKGRSPLYLAVDGTLAAVLGVADPVKPTTAAALANLRQQGLRLVMITGDAKATATMIAQELGITDVVAEVLPAAKVAALADLRQHGPVAFVGDGINDAPALAAADVGIVMGAMGSDAALETADIALMTDELPKVPYTIRLSHATLANIRTNVAISIAFKAVFVVLAVSGVATLWMAVLADTGASALVVANAVRLRHFR